MKRKTLFLIAAILVLGAAIVGLALFREYERTAPTEKNYPLGPAETTEAAIDEVEATRTLILAFDDSLDSPYGQLAQLYKEQVETMSDGQLKIEIFENGLLGRCYDMLANAGSGISADLLLTAASDVADAGCTEVADLMDAGKFKGHNEFLKWASSKAAQTLLDNPEKDGLGMRGLFFAEDGFEYLFFRDAVTETKDKTISPEGDDYCYEFVEQLGAVAQHTPSIDLKADLDEGTLDGVAWSLRLYASYELWDSAPYIAETNRLESPYMALITQQAAEDLTDKQLELLQKAGRNAVEQFTQTVSQTENDVLKEAGEHGASVLNLK